MPLVRGAKEIGPTYDVQYIPRRWCWIQIPDETITATSCEQEEDEEKEMNDEGAKFSGNEKFDLNYNFVHWKIRTLERIKTIKIIRVSSIFAYMFS